MKDSTLAGEQVYLIRNREDEESSSWLSLRIPENLSHYECIKANPWDILKKHFGSFKGKILLSDGFRWEVKVEVLGEDEFGSDVKKISLCCLEEGLENLILSNTTL